MIRVKGQNVKFRAVNSQDLDCGRSRDYRVHMGVTAPCILAEPARAHTTPEHKGLKRLTSEKEIRSRHVRFDYITCTVDKSW